jgi:hypothetical protein
MKLERTAGHSFLSLRALAQLTLKPFGIRFGLAHRVYPRLALVERISLAPRQSLALVEAEGRLLLVATSAEGGSAFYPLNPGPQRVPQRRSRVSW